MLKNDKQKEHTKVWTFESHTSLFTFVIFVKYKKKYQKRKKICELFVRTHEIFMYM